MEKRGLLSVCLSACLSVNHVRAPYKNDCTDRNAVWVGDSGGPKEPCIKSESRSYDRIHIFQ